MGLIRKLILWVAATIGLLLSMQLAATDNSQAGSPLFGVKLPADYRDWRAISVAHEAGNLKDIRMVLGNDLAFQAYRRGIRPFPDGSKIARVAYKMIPSPRNNAIFGRDQSFIAGPPTNVQISVKDSKRYASTGGWGYGQFEAGRPNPSVELMSTCFTCHVRLSASSDFVFTEYSP